MSSPDTEAHCSTRFSSAGNPSSRAAIIARTVVGTRSSICGSATIHPEAVETNPPASTSMLKLSSRNSGFPPARVTTLRRAGVNAFLPRASERQLAHGVIGDRVELDPGLGLQAMQAIRIG